jgi:hypothetical protein
MHSETPKTSITSDNPRHLHSVKGFKAIRLKDKRLKQTVMASQKERIFMEPPNKCDVTE